VSSTGGIYVNEIPLGGLWSGWSSELSAPTGGILGGIHPSLAVVRRGGAYMNGEDLFVRGSLQNLFYQSYYSTGPTYTPPTATLGKTLSGSLPIWENTSLAISPSNTNAGCGANGALLVSFGSNVRVWRTSLSCITSTSVSSCSSNSDVSYGDPLKWPAVVQSGQNDAAPIGPNASSDQQLVRFSDGSILLVHQGVRRDVGSTGACTGPYTCRGVEYVFRSTNCGGNWSFVSVLDPKFDGPPGSPSKYYNTSTQAGHDRVEVYADPYNPGRVYMTMMGSGNQVPAWTVLYRSNDRGSTWTWAGETQQQHIPAYMTTTSSGRLYMTAVSGGQLSVAVYDPTSGTFYQPHNLASVAMHPGVNVANGGYGISRIGSFSDGDYLRLHYNVLNASSDYGLQIMVVRISGTPPTYQIVQGEPVPLSTGRSIVGATAVETDRTDWTENLQANPAMIYWYDIATTGSGGNYGPAHVGYKYFYDTSSSSSLGCMSLQGSPSTCHSWSTYTNVYGDYQKGAFWFSGPKDLKYLALWAEQPTSSTVAVKTNLMKLTLP
jgi:hypothetical protein